MSAYDQLKFHENLSEVPFTIRELPKRRLVDAYSNLTEYPNKNSYEFKEVVSFMDKHKCMQMGLYEPPHVFPRLFKDKTMREEMVMCPHPIVDMKKTIAAIRDPSSMKFVSECTNVAMTPVEQLTMVQLAIYTALKDVDPPLCLYTEAAVEECKNASASMEFFKCTNMTMGTSIASVLYQNTLVSMIPEMIEENSTYKFEDKLVYQEKYKNFFCASFASSSPAALADMLLADGVDMIADMSSCMDVVEAMFKVKPMDKTKRKSKNERFYLYWRGFEVEVSAKHFKRVKTLSERMKNHVNVPSCLPIYMDLDDVRYNIMVVFEAMGMLKRDAMDVVAVKTSGAIKELIPFVDRDQSVNVYKRQTKTEYAFMDNLKSRYKNKPSDPLTNKVAGSATLLFKALGKGPRYEKYTPDSMDLDEVMGILEGTDKDKGEGRFKYPSSHPCMNRLASEYQNKGECLLSDDDEDNFSDRSSSQSLNSSSSLDLYSSSDSYSTLPVDADAVLNPNAGQAGGVGQHLDGSDSEGEEQIEELNAAQAEVATMSAVLAACVNLSWADQVEQAEYDAKSLDESEDSDKYSDLVVCAYKFGARDGLSSPQPTEAGTASERMFLDESEGVLSLRGRTTRKKLIRVAHYTKNKIKGFVPYVRVPKFKLPCMFMSSTEFQYARENTDMYASRIVDKDKAIIKMLNASSFVKPVEIEYVESVLEKGWNESEPCTTLSTLGNCQPFITYNQPPRPTLGIQTKRQTLDMGWIKTDAYFRSTIERRPLLSTSTVYKSEALSLANSGPAGVVVFAMDLDNATYESGIAIGEWMLDEFEYTQVVQAEVMDGMKAYPTGTNVDEIESWRPTVQNYSNVLGFTIRDGKRVMYVIEKKRRPEYQDKFVLNHGTKGTFNRVIKKGSRIAVKCPISDEVVIADFVMEPVTTRNAYGPLIEGSFNYHALAGNVYDSANLNKPEAFFPHPTLYKAKGVKMSDLLFKRAYENEGKIKNTDKAEVKDLYSLQNMNVSKGMFEYYLQHGELARIKGGFERMYLTKHGMDQYVKDNPRDWVVLEGELMVEDPHTNEFKVVLKDGKPVMANFGILNVEQVGHMSGTNQQYFDKEAIKSVSLPKGRLSGGTTRMGIDDILVLLANGFKDQAEMALLGGDGIVTEVCSKCKHYAMFCDCPEGEEKTKAWVKVVTRYSLMRMDVMATIASINSKNADEPEDRIEAPTTRVFMLPESSKD